MKKLLVTGGTVFVSRYIAEYYSKKEYEVYVMNRNSRKQSKNVTLIETDRHTIGDKLKKYDFDVVVDVTAYNGNDISDFVNALGTFDKYIMVSSSAVYPETEKQPFTESIKAAPNSIWGSYGINKINAENTLLKLVPDAYILRSPYLYGAMNNLYRKAFVFDCAMNERKFYLPQNGEMKLQFFHIKDLCGLIETIVIGYFKKRYIYNIQT